MKQLETLVSYLYPMKFLKAGNYLIRLWRSRYYKRILCAGNNFYVYSVRNIKGEEKITVGDNFNAGKQLRLEAWTEYENKKYDPIIKIGDNAIIGDDNHIGSINEIIIGDNLLTGSNVYITDHNHGNSDEAECLIPPVKRNLYSKGSVYIGDNVWLGNNVVIMPNVTIGNGVVIGANSVVTKSVPDYCIAVGVPAKIIRRNNPQNN